MFEKVKKIVEKINENKAFDDEYSKKLSEISNGGHFMEEHVEVANLGIEAQIRKIENKILYDNARIELFKEVMPKAIKVWNEYENKQYGEKTKDKIRQRIKEETGCWFYARGDEFNLTVDYMVDKALSYFFRNKDLDVVSNPYGKKFLVNNRIQHVEFDELKLAYCNDYVENTHEEAESIYNELKNLEREFESLRKRTSDLNNRLPSRCDTINLGYPRFYVG